MKLNELHDNPGARQKRTRVGRGIGSGKGKTSAKGQKGQKARKGVAINGFEGGQMPLYQRLPKRGFNNIFAKKFNEINLGQIQSFIDAKRLDIKKPITEQMLVEAGIVRRLHDGIRLLGKGELKSKIELLVAGSSKSAVDAVEKLGGKITLSAVKNADRVTVRKLPAKNKETDSSKESK